MEKLLILLLVVGCAPFEPIPGLCYTDKTGTYLCMEEEEEKEEPTKWDECKIWTNAEVWSQCMIS